MRRYPTSLVEPVRCSRSEFDAVQMFAVQRRLQEAEVFSEQSRSSAPQKLDRPSTPRVQSLWEGRSFGGLLFRRYPCTQIAGTGTQTMQRSSGFFSQTR